jgi:hypothetical protein
LSRNLKDLYGNLLLRYRDLDLSMFISEDEEFDFPLVSQNMDPAHYDDFCICNICSNLTAEVSADSFANWLYTCVAIEVHLISPQCTRTESSIISL